MGLETLWPSTAINPSQNGQWEIMVENVNPQHLKVCFQPRPRPRSQRWHTVTRYGYSHQLFNYLIQYKTTLSAHIDLQYFLYKKKSGVHIFSHILLSSSLVHAWCITHCVTLLEIATAMKEDWIKSSEDLLSKWVRKIALWKDNIQVSLDSEMGGI